MSENDITKILLDDNYKSSFTPDGEKEFGKTCYNCKNHLPARKFKSKKTIRNGVKGTARNEKCRDCESINIDVRKTVKLEALEDNIDILTQDNEKIKQTFNKTIRSLRQDIDHLIEENKKIREELRIMKNEKNSSTKDIVSVNDLLF